MLYFFKNNDETGRMIAERLQQMSAAHKLFMVDQGESYLSEYEHDYKNREEISAFLDRYEKQLNDQLIISADACYVDPESGDSNCII